MEIKSVKDSLLFFVEEKLIRSGVLQFKKKTPTVEVGLADYLERANAEVARRLRIVAPPGAILHFLFIFLDQATYPALAGLFFWGRLLSCFIVFLNFGLTFVLHRSFPYIWLSNFCFIAAGLSMTWMVALGDGVRSNYYEGLNLIFLLSSALTCFFPFHNFVIAGTLVVAYAIAIYVNPVPVTFALLAPKIFFMGSTICFVMAISFFYRKRDYQEFLRAEEISKTAANLEATNRRLTEMEKVKSEFFANVSHELRTPLTLILGPLQNLSTAKGVTPEVQKELSVIGRNARMLLKHVNDLLDLSKLDARKMEVEREQVDISQLVKLVCSHFESSSAERRIQFHLEIGSSLGALPMDRAKLERVLFNLLSNAFKFTPDGGVIRVRADNQDGLLSLSVEDSGPGVPQKQRAVIFERFRQAESGDARRYGGTGLGLSVSKEFVELLQGSIWVQDSSLGGAKFCVDLPIGSELEIGVSAAKAESVLAPEAFVPEKEVPSVLAGFSSEVKGRVLVVEDHPDMRQFICSTLGARWEVQSAELAERALGFLKENPERLPDLIVSDVMMPGMSGEEFIRKVRENPDYERISILVLTAKADPTLGERCIRSGAQDFLVKPFLPGELLARSESLITMKRIRDILEQELSKQNRSIVDMTLDLARSHAEKNTALHLAERNGRIREEVLRNLSHELRTPMFAILGWLELIQEGGLNDSEIANALNVVFSNAKEQDRLISTLLELSVLLTGDLTLHAENEDLVKILQSVIQSVVLPVSAKRVSLRSSFQVPSAPILADGSRLKQAFWNLLMNAVKFTPEKGVIVVSLRDVEGFWEVEIEDTGDGIEPAYLPHLFDLFSQEDASTQRKYGGAGMGLSISKHLVEVHGGGISVQSDGKGKGTVFTVRLPKSARVLAAMPSANTSAIEDSF